jgi:hypothetical protein
VKPVITESAQLADARGFAWLRALVGSIGCVFAALSLWIMRTRRDEGDA